LWSERIFGSSRKGEAVQIVFHNACLQKVIEFVANAYEEYKIAMNKINAKFDLKKNVNLEV
jgi:hypothetical protein